MATQRDFCFTINNYTPQEIDYVNDITSRYIVYGKEISNSGTPHLQGYILFTNKRSLNGVKKTFKINGKQHHVENGRDPDVPHGIAYCKKGQQPHEEFVSLGTNGPNYGLNADIYERGDPPISAIEVGRDEKARHKRIRELAILGDFDTLSNEHFDYYINHDKALHRFHHLYRPKRYPPCFVTPESIYPWQKALLDRLSQPCNNNREILFLFDEEGQHGKSQIAIYCSKILPNVQTLTPAKYPDLAYLLKETTEILFIDFSKTFDMLNYTSVLDLCEHIKTGKVISTKYTPCEKTFTKHTHIVIFSNEYLDTSKLTKDRPICHNYPFLDL